MSHNGAVESSEKASAASPRSPTKDAKEPGTQTSNELKDDTTQEPNTFDVCQCNHLVRPHIDPLFSGVHEQVVADVFPELVQSNLRSTRMANHDDQRLKHGLLVEAIGISFPFFEQVQPVVMLPHTGKHYRYTLKEGEEFDVFLHILVCGHVRGLRFSNTVYKLGLPVDRTKRDLGDLPPRSQPYTLHAIRARAPTGFLVRGSYKGHALLLDAEGREVCSFEYALDIRREWDANK